MTANHARIGELPFPHRTCRIMDSGLVAINAKRRDGPPHDTGDCLAALKQAIFR